MRKYLQFTITLIVLLLCSCVSKSEYDNSKSDNNRLKAEIEKIKFGAERRYKTALDYLNAKEYLKAHTEMNTFFEKHPEAKSDIKYTQLLSKINAAIEQQRKEEDAKKAAFDRELNKNIKKHFDEFEKITWYSTKRNVSYHKKNSSYIVEVYIAAVDNIAKAFHLRTEYNDRQSDYYDTLWIFYDEVQLLGNNGANLAVTCEYPKKQTEVYSGGLKEWCDCVVPEREMLQFENAQSVKVRFSGKYTETFNMTNEQLKALKEIIEKFKRM